MGLQPTKGDEDAYRKGTGRLRSRLGMRHTVTEPRP